jgi:hypothetical protein
MVGLLLLVFVTRGTVSLAIHSDERREVDSIEIESHESPKVFVNTQQFPANNGQIISRYSDEYDDLSLERVHNIGPVSGSQFSAPIQTTSNGPRVQSPNIRNPVLIHSDEHDTFSVEVSLAGILANTQQSAQTTQMASNGGQEPVTSHIGRGKRIFKQPDERHIVSARPGKQVIIRTGATPGSPIQTTSMHNKATYRHSDEHDDYSDEVRSILTPANPNIPSSGPVYRLRSGTEHGSLPWREGEDDVHVQIDPLTKQVVNIRTELRDSIEHDVDFSDQITSRIATLPSMTSPVNANAAGNVQTPLTVNRRLYSQHSDEFDDRSYEVIRGAVNTNQRNGRNFTAPTQGVRLVSRHSDEHDDSLEFVRGIPIGQNRPAAVVPVQTSVTGSHVIGRHSDEVDDISLELVRPIAAVGGAVNPHQVATGVEHLLRHSDEHDSSIEVIGRIENLPFNVPVPTAVQNQGVHLVPTHSGELDDVSLEVHLIRNQTGSGQGVHLISRHSDERYDDASLEVVRQTVLNPGPNPTAPVQGVIQVVSRHSDELGDTSLEVHLIRNQTAPGQIRLLKHSDEHYDVSLEDTGTILNLQNGQILTGQIRPAQTGEQHLIRHSDEVDDVSLEILHTGTSGVQPPMSVSGIVPAIAASATGVEHLLTHSDEQHDISLEDVIRRAPSKVGIMQQTSIPVQQDVLFRDSHEHEDLSLEVDINLLPEIQRLLTNVRTDVKVVLPQVPTQTAPPSSPVVITTAVNQGNLVVEQPRMSRVLKHNVSQELREILANPLFQQKIQEIDSRLKSAPDSSRTKRLIEKYVEALALSSPAPINAATTTTTINSSFYLSLFITYWVSVWFL